MRRWPAALALLVLMGCARLDISSIGLHEWVVTGGQAQLDQGHVVDVNGVPGIWIAGHRTSHGAVFNALPSVPVGAQVCIYSKCWHVLRKIIVPQSYFPPPQGLAPLVLQTSWPGGRLMLVICG